MPLGLVRLSDLVEKSMELESFDRRRDQQRSGGPMRTGGTGRGNFQRGAIRGRGDRPQPGRAGPYVRPAQRPTTSSGSEIAHTQGCYRCGGSHLARDCTVAVVGTGDRSIQCFHCGKTGHIARNCYHLRRYPERPQAGGGGGGNGRGAGPRHDAGVARQ